MYDKLTEIGVGHLYHFTPLSNIPSIQQYGLFPAQALANANALFTYGGNELSQQLDRQTGMDTYIHLAFVTNHPMAYSQDRPHGWFKVNLEVLQNPDVRFTSVVANSNDAEPMTAQQAIESLDFAGIYADKLPGYDRVPLEQWISAIKAEVLVPNHISQQLLRYP